MRKRLVLAVTGIRSDYDILSSVLHEIKNHPELELQVVVTGAHLSEDFGFTVSEIEKDGFQIVEKIENLLNSDSASSRVKGLSIQLQGLTQTIARIKPDLLLVLGDREESITTALVGAYTNIPVAHIGGGDRAIGNVDDQIRHAVTKLSHLHFVTNKESEERVLKLGEQPFRVHNVGNPGLDRFRNTPMLSISEISERLKIDLIPGEPFLIMIQHVISSEIGQAYEQVKESLEALKELGVATILIHPNSDAGSQQIVKAIQEYETLPFIHIAKNVPRLEFINLMRNASCLLGNSSSGILEAPYLKLPVINVGNRQRGRLHSDNVQFVNHSRSEIVTALKRAIFDDDFRKKILGSSNPYGDGYSSSRIATTLANVDLNADLLIKDITF
jgi:GDP/UDP-N,N'-diacetylbacillosamine 2-epimerase (hydrolysing)